MESLTTGTDKPADHTSLPEQQSEVPLASKSDPSSSQDKATSSSTTSPEVKQHRHKRRSKRVSKKSKERAVSSSSDTSSSDSDSNLSDELSTSTTSEDTSRERRKKKGKKKNYKQKSLSSSDKKKLGKNTKSSRRSALVSDPETSDTTDSEDETTNTEDKKRRRRHKRTRSRRQRIYDDDEDGSEGDETDFQDDQNARLRAELAALSMHRGVSGGGGGVAPGRLNGLRAPRYRGAVYEEPPLDRYNDRIKAKAKKKRRKGKRASTLEYKRVDQLWDSSIHNYKLTESAEDQEDAFDQYVFTVRRRFDWENKYKNTVVDIKSKLLREALQDVMKDVKGVSLVEDQPSIDPNMLFLYLDEIRKYTRKTLKSQAKAEKKRKNKKKILLKIAQCKVLLGYIDQDYEETKKTLYPMLEAGNITFDLLWALFKPNSIAYTPTYGNVEEPRCFKVDYATKESSFMRGEWYSVEGRYLEYDGKSFGLGDFEAQIDAFKGPRKITSLASYPLEYHKDADGLKRILVERGKKFVALEGMNYRFHKGMAFMKKKRTVAKVNINGRIMVDPNLFRRINPNYPISVIKPKDPEEDYYQSDDNCTGCCSSSDEERKDDEDAEGPQLPSEEKEKERTKFKFIRDKSDNVHIVQVMVDENGQEEQVENLDKLPEGVDPKQKREFSEEELLISSPVVLGFAFSEKLWLEFSISGLRDIEWNEGAFDSLVLPANQKSIVKALVESHKFHAAKTIDDVVQGKGKGLVAVLHGPPGTGKTLTAEGIAELLKCPLYMVSAGELGTDPRILEHELQKILDIAHSWGAVLLLDEADVFLEKREVHDIHRNALVSIFLRLLEYFQGILFLTTNRVETFDDAFQSRIHVALRYGELTAKAKRAVWKLFLDKVQVMESATVARPCVPHAAIEDPSTSSSSGTSTTAITPSMSPSEPDANKSFKESDYDSLARRPLNGRQIKNAVRTSQALAVNRKEKLAMHHILEVLEVAESFEQDLRGGIGYREAMRSYT